MQFQPVIRWSGGKRKQSEDIINRMPNKVGTVYIPFLGGGSIVYQLVNSNIKFDKVVASDIYGTLMTIWDLIKNTPELLMTGYTKLYNNFDASLDKVKLYEDMVYKFNVEGGDDAILFFFLVRCCTRGSIMFDKYGNFCSKMSENDRPIKPNILEPILQRWHEAFQDVELRCESYEDTIKDATENDFVFLDPPYIDGTWYRHHTMDWDKMWEQIRALPCDYSMTLNGDREVYPIPEDLYDEHEYIYYGITTTSQGNKAGSRDSLWMRKRICIYTPDIINVKQNGRPSGGRSNSTITDMKALLEMNGRMDKMEKSIDEMKGMFAQIMGAIGGK